MPNPLIAPMNSPYSTMRKVILLAPIYSTRKLRDHMPKSGVSKLFLLKSR